MQKRDVETGKGGRVATRGVRRGKGRAASGFEESGAVLPPPPCDVVRTDAGGEVVGGVGFVRLGAGGGVELAGSARVGWFG
jgi:hypothetical protein